MNSKNQTTRTRFAAVAILSLCACSPAPTVTPAAVQVTADAVHKLACLGHVVDAMARVDPGLAQQLRFAIQSGRPLTAQESALVLEFCERLGAAKECLR